MRVQQENINNNNNNIYLHFHLHRRYCIGEKKIKQKKNKIEDNSRKIQQ